jgi:hypothetical protein
MSPPRRRLPYSPSADTAEEHKREVNGMHWLEGLGQKKQLT